MDRAGWDARTDVLVIVDPRRRRLTWVPRDLWCPGLGDRVNTAFAHGGHPALRDALAEHRIRVERGIVLARAATERALEHATVRVPVDEPLRVRYPLHPTKYVMADGEQVIAFDPPHEDLGGIRIHAWLGARHLVGHPAPTFTASRGSRSSSAPCSRWASTSPSSSPTRRSRMSGPDALDELRTVDAGWRMRTLGRPVDADRDGRMVLVRRSPRRPRG